MAFEHGGALRIEVEGVKETIDALRRIDRALVTELKKGFREDAQPILSSAKGYARALGGSGDYAASMAIRTIKDGVRIQASDPGSGTIEFAHRGAFYRSGVRAGKPAGVPSGNPPARSGQGVARARGRGEAKRRDAHRARDYEVSPWVRHPSP